MEIGKVPNDILQKIVLDKLTTSRPEVKESGGIGIDTATIDFGDNFAVMSCDPITGATENLGKLAINVAVNDIATKGSEPVCALTSILLPPSTQYEELEKLIVDLNNEAEALNINIVGGHTEVTDAVNRIVVTTTVIGKLAKDETMADVEIGDLVVVTKDVGIEGTSIIAHEKEELIGHKLGYGEMLSARELADDLSVLKEGILGKRYNAKYMHDITEGGLLGAAWETAEALEQGLIIFKDRIPVREITKRICSVLDIDPLKLVSSGSMLIVINQLDYIKLQGKLESEGIKSTVIGRVTEFDGAYISEDNNLKLISPPGADEIYKVHY